MEFEKRKLLERFLEWVSVRGVRLEKKIMEEAKSLILGKSCENELLSRHFQEFSRDIFSAMRAGEKIISLVEISPQMSAKICSILPASEEKIRLQELGFVSGAVITCLRVAPLGDPVEYSLSGFHISLRKEEASLVMVKLVNDESSN